MSDLLAELRQWQDQLRDLPEPLAYIVLDHGHPVHVASFGRDGKGKRYAIMSPAILDSVKHLDTDDMPAPRTELLSPWMTGTPLIRRENLPEGWPTYATAR